MSSVQPGEGVVAAPAGADGETAQRVRARGLALTVLATAAAVAIGLDLVTKELALTHLGDGSTVRILGGAIYFDLTRNSGAAFSIGSDFTFVFAIIAMVVMIGIVVVARRLRSQAWAVSLGLIFGGAAGNLVDRIFRAPAPLHGHVVDFISAFAPAGRYFPIFNVADSALFCGVVLAIFLEFTGRHRDGTRVRHSDRAER